MGLPHPQADSKLLREHNFYDEPENSGSSSPGDMVRHHCNLSALHLAILLLVVVLVVKMHYVLKRFYGGYLNRSHSLLVMSSPKSPSKMIMGEKKHVDDLV